jgi:hypothetical protein
VRDVFSGARFCALAQIHIYGFKGISPFQLILFYCYLSHVLLFSLVLFMSDNLTRLGRLFGCERHRLHELCSFLLSSVKRPVELHGMLRRQLLCHDRAHCGDGDVCSRQILRLDCERLHQLQRWLLSRHRRAVVLHDLFIGSYFNFFLLPPRAISMVSKDQVCWRGFCSCVPSERTFKLLKRTPIYSNFRVVSHLRLRFFLLFCLCQHP